MVQARCFGTTGSGTPGSLTMQNRTIAWQGLSSTLPTSIFNAASKAQGIEVSFCKKLQRWWSPCDPSWEATKHVTTWKEIACTEAPCRETSTACNVTWNKLIVDQCLLLGHCTPFLLNARTSTAIPDLICSKICHVQSTLGHMKKATKVILAAIAGKTPLVPHFSLNWTKIEFHPSNPTRFCTPYIEIQK